MKRLVVILLTLFALNVGYAQNLTISFDGNVEEMTTDLDARALFPKKDINDNLCALIKVTLTNALKNPLVLETGALGVTERVVQESGEVWFYVPAGVKNLSFKCAEYAPMDPIPVRLKAGTVYRLTLNPDAIFETISNATLSTNYLKIQLNEESARIAIGRTKEYELLSQSVEGDVFVQLLEYGTYYFKVEHPLRETYYGEVTVNASTPKLNVSLAPAFGYLTVESTPSGADLYMGNRRLGSTPCKIEERMAKGSVELRLESADYHNKTFTIYIKGDGSRQTTHQTLKPRFANITLTCPDSEAEIWVDNEFKAKGTWTGRLGSISSHYVEARRASHRSQSIKVEVVEGEDRNYSLPEPVAMYGTLNITTTPLECHLSIDGEPAGETPVIRQVLVGEHTIELSQEGYITKTLTVTVEHNQTLTLNETLDEDTEEMRLLQLRRDAEAGDAEAQFELGERYYKGDGVAQDYSEAVKWYRKAAEQGDASAQNNLGYCYQNGYGVAQDYTEAVKWYRKAAEQGYASAQNNLGVCYEYGYGVAQDYTEAVKWYRKAAEQGDASAQNNLGDCYYYGYGVAQDYSEAVKWFRKAAEQGYAPAQNNLGYCYRNGYGVAQDYTEAVKWYRKATEQGNARAQNNLGYCYECGYGVAQDYTEAVKWYRKAARQGEETAQNNLRNLGYDW